MSFMKQASFPAHCLLQKRIIQHNVTFVAKKKKTIVKYKKIKYKRK